MRKQMILQLLIIFSSFNVFSQVKYIPVVFHILHTGGSENITDAQITDAINILNSDYRHPDTAHIDPFFRSIAADCEIEFRLAQIDPSGNPTNGIDRIYTILSDNANDSSKINPWPKEKYLNIWTVKTIGTAGTDGYTYPPYHDTSLFTTGTIIVNDFVGSVGTGHAYSSHSLTHEIAKFFNLRHSYNLTGGCIDVDSVYDTPPLDSMLTTCSYVMSCDGVRPYNIENYMEYTYCSKMFTWGQKARMQACLNSPVAQRNNLWTTPNLIATGIYSLIPCIATVTDSIYKDTSMTYTWNILPTYSSAITSARWYWGDGTDTIALYPSHTYDTAGIYTICVTAYASCGDSVILCHNDSIYKTMNSAFVHVNVVNSFMTNVGGFIKNRNSSLLVYPNPASNNLTVSNISGKTILRLFDMLGKVVLEKKTDVNTTLDISYLKPGIYTLSSETNNGISFNKVVVSNK